MLSSKEWNKLISWYKKNGRHELPWRATSSPWGIFVAETLLRRTRAKNVAEIYNSLIKEFQWPGDVVNNPKSWKEHTESLGIPSRNELFVKACEVLTRKYHGQIPKDLDQLKALPGAGHYLCCAVRSFAFEIPGYIIDTNTLRIASRITGNSIKQAGHRSKRARDVIQKCFGEIESMTSQRNFSLLDLGDSKCKAKNPVCYTCPLNQACQFSHTKNMHK